MKLTLLFAFFSRSLSLSLGLSFCSLFLSISMFCRFVVCYCYLFVFSLFFLSFIFLTCWGIIQSFSRCTRCYRTQNRRILSFSFISILNSSFRNAPRVCVSVLLGIFFLFCDIARARQLTSCSVVLMQ